MQQQPHEPQGQTGAEAAFLAAFGGPFDMGRRLGFLHEAALVIAHDVPYAMGKQDYADHLAFHAEAWETLELLPNALLTRLHGDSAIVSCYFSERGKPKNAGFRLRPGFLTAICHRGSAGWLAFGLHMSSLRAQILDASPG